VVVYVLGLALLAGVAQAAGPSDREPPGVRQAPGWEFFAATNVPAFRLDIDSAGLRSLRQTPRDWAHGTLRFGGRTFEDVGVHIKGSEGSLQPIDRRPSLTVNLKKFVPGQNFFGLHKIHFNNTAEDPTFMTEVICSELYRQAGVPAARSAHGTLTLNGRALGLYVVKEGLTKEFLAQYFRRTDGALYDGGFQQDITTPFELIGGDGPENQADRLELLAAAREPDLARRWTRLQQRLDSDRFISLLAMSTLTWNWDGYPMAFNNYRVYHDPASERMVFIPHGLDQMFWQPQGSIYPRFRGLLARAVMQVPEARQLYRARLKTLQTNVFQVSVLNRRIDELAALITPYRPETVTQAARLKKLIAGRAQFVGAQLELPEPVSPNFTNHRAVLTGWTQSPAAAKGGLSVASVEGAVRALRFLRSEPTTSVSTLRVWLPSGPYELVGRVRVVRLSVGDKDGPDGVALRASTPLRTSSRRLVAASGWEELRCRFDSQGSEEIVDLTCEVRNAAGEVWFDLGSLQLQRVTSAASRLFLNPRR
jgi:spore coat protein H